MRGIPELVLHPEGNNLVILGPNGSGKSAIVDSIEFLFTGKMARLEGRGTKDISLKKHGPHINYKPKDAWITATIKLKDSDEIFKITRNMSKPKDLIVDKGSEENLKPALEAVSRGLHTLSRREILKYITADASTRGQEIQIFLDMEDIKKTREHFVKFKNWAESLRSTYANTVSSSEQGICVITDHDTYNDKSVLTYINEQRKILKGKNITTLKSSNVKKDLESVLTTGEKQKINPELLELDIQNIISVVDKESLKPLSDATTKLEEHLELIKSDEELIRELKRLKLTEKGLLLIDDSGNCPLCDKEWAPGELATYLKIKVDKAGIAKRIVKDITGYSTIIKEPINKILESVSKVIHAAKDVKLNSFVASIQQWEVQLSLLQKCLDEPIETYSENKFSKAKVQSLFVPSNIETITSSLMKKINKKYPKQTARHTAWDKLTRLEEHLNTLEQAKSDIKDGKLLSQRAKIIYDSFNIARDDVLESIYNDICVQFQTLYKQIHGSDENNFNAIIQPSEAGVDLSVDFYGKGLYPPHALHSEGHQDSMGMCLFLSLSEKFGGDLLDLIILDDVVMSIDVDHRKPICALFTESFPNHQFIITTHDKTWANQLKSEKVVMSKNLIELYNWNVDTGPKKNSYSDIWKSVEENLNKNDIPSAAFSLRNGSEEYFSNVCENLGALVPYRLDNTYDLGIMLNAAIARYRKLLKIGKQSANSFNDQSLMDTLTEIDSTSSSIILRSSAEQWAINSNVHYNSWMNFSKKEFQQVSDSFQDLFALFKCSKCGKMLKVVSSNNIDTDFRCDCKSSGWNLKIKS